MNTKSLFALFLALCLAVAISACGGTPSTPTKAPVTSAPPAITVIVTATLPPPPPTLAIPTITPIPTPVITATTPITTPASVKAATPVSGTPRATATKRPATPTKAAVVVPTAVPVKYAAPTPLEPIFGGDRKDSRHYPGESLVFKWTAVAGLAPDECYLVNVTFNPGQGDQFLTGCGNQSPLGSPVSFTLNKPGFASPNYSSLLPSAGQDITVIWYVTVVKNLGPKPDNVHFNTAPLSPPSDKVQFLLIGG